MGQSPVMHPLGLVTSLAPSVDSQKATVTIQKRINHHTFKANEKKRWGMVGSENLFLYANTLSISP